VSGTAGKRFDRLREYEMKRAEIEERVIRTVAETMNVAPERLTAETSFVSDLDADSVAMVDVLMALEDAFGIELIDKYKQEIKTVADAIDCVVAQLPA
jgi:acyl carrier protein